jgi:hypothetical protein
LPSERSAAIPYLFSACAQLAYLVSRRRRVQGWLLARDLCIHRGQRAAAQGHQPVAHGLDWTWYGPALRPRPSEWDGRGVRVTDVRFTPGGVLAHYDGRASAAENFEERTGIAFGPVPGALTAVGSAPAAQSPAAGRGLRYLSVLRLRDGRERLYYELTRADGARGRRARAGDRTALTARSHGPSDRRPWPAKAVSDALPVPVFRARGQYSSPSGCHGSSVTTGRVTSRTSAPLTCGLTAAWTDYWRIKPY